MLCGSSVELSCDVTYVVKHLWEQIFAGQPQSQPEHRLQVSGKGVRGAHAVHAADAVSSEKGCRARCYMISTPASSSQVLQTFQKARELGLTVLRMWAFADGPYEWNALQPELELLDDRVLRRARSFAAVAQHLGSQTGWYCCTHCTAGPQVATASRNCSGGWHRLRSVHGLLGCDMLGATLYDSC